MITLAYMPAYEGDEREAILLARNLSRIVQDPAFAGAQIGLFYPAHLGLSAELSGALADLPVQALPFEIPDAFRDFPLGQKVFAAAQAEAWARGETLAWLDSDNLIVRPPAAFCLPPGKKLAACPVQLKNISSLAAEAPNGFWETIYRHCQVPPERIFTITTVMDRAVVRAHFNAGCLVVRPESGLLAAWKTNFAALAHTEILRGFYAQHSLYHFFVHQAVLAATILAHLQPEEISILPETYNFPIFLRERFNLAPPPDVVTLRYDRYEFIETHPELLAQYGAG